jgi:purine-binding chemotaxis protein CheW
MVARSGKYLTFELGGEVYGLEILKVQEIIGMMNVTRVPRTAPYVRGVINLRGKVIPVIDLRLKFGLEAREDTERTCIIVVQVARADHQVTMGIIVDEVSEVLDLGADQIEPTPSLGASVDTEFILGMGKVGQRVLTMLDMDAMLTGDRIGTVEKGT